MSSLRLTTEIEQWPLSAPFRISGYTFVSVDVLLVCVEKDGTIGRGEAAGIYYRGDTPAAMIAQIHPVRAEIERGISRDDLQEMLPPGGARNALDCALWDLETQLSGKPAWQLAGLQQPKPIITTLGCGADTPENMASVARGYLGARAIKLKLTGEPIDADRIMAIRDVCPDVWLSVDANQGFTRPLLEELMPLLVKMRVSVIEQPFPVGEEALLNGFKSPIPIAADESVQSCVDIPALADNFDLINIKLDKCGGLTEALRMIKLAHELGLGTMVGNMIGTSLAMAPAWLIGQECTSVVDLDGPIFLKSDRELTVSYAEGCIACPESLWGHPHTSDKR